MGGIAQGEDVGSAGGGGRCAGRCRVGTGFAGFGREAGAAATCCAGGVTAGSTLACACERQASTPAAAAASRTTALQISRRRWRTQAGIGARAGRPEPDPVGERQLLRRAGVLTLPGHVHTRHGRARRADLRGPPRLRAVGAARGSRTAPRAAGWPRRSASRGRARERGPGAGCSWPPASRLRRPAGRRARAAAWSPASSACSVRSRRSRAISAPSASSGRACRRRPATGRSTGARTRRCAC